MRIRIVAIGKCRPGPERSLFDEYVKRVPWKVELKELVPGRDRAGETRKLLDACGKVDRLVALDEQGEALSSEEFARRISRFQEQGASLIGFILGGSDGLDRAQLAQAQLTLSFGRATWPHMLARAMLAEQLYRAHTLLTGHPYHRA
jgi:23S rRNA (pseudouridine1915-N3)-methyltransferase